MYWVIPIAIFVIFFWTCVPMLIEHHATKKKEKEQMQNKLNEIFDMRSEGLCDSCEHGFDKCIKCGKPLCKEDDDEDAVQFLSR